MTLETFFEKFELFAEAPNAVAKMRELILEYAIRGKLVLNESSANPISDLLERIENDKEQLPRNQRELPPVDEEAFCQIPETWAWTRLGKIGRIFNGDSVSETGKAELAKVGDGLPFIATKDVGYGRNPLQYENGLKVPHGDPRFKIARSNSVLICAEGGSAGKKIGINDRDICFGNKLFANEVLDGVDHRYIFYLYQAPSFYKEFSARMTGIIGGISRGEFLMLPIPLPPEAEQRRIVAKVDELMALCDRLEAQQKERDERHVVLARASISRFAESPTPANLDYLFHPSYPIPPADLRKAILTLAVQGKLVPQDPSEEGVEAWLGRNDDVRHVTSKVDHRASPECLPLLSAEDRWSIPKTWKWRALADLVLFVDYRGKTPAKLKSGVRLLTAKNVRKGHINLSPEEFISEAEYGAWMTRGIPKVGDVLFTTEAPMGNAAVIDLTDRFALAQRVICFQSYGAIDSEFLVMQILSDQFQFLLAKNGTGMTAKGMKASKLKQLPVALPPLAEQRRITARVRQLSNLLGELGSVQESSNATATTLLAAIMEQMSGLECPSQSDPAQLVAAYIGDPGPCLSKP